mmetsp:Transcript_40601/g.56434  ORF Transcript_40601/g.56434 Transcript_40601/m.56434 type:complete len:89 (-) Transcript_40601:315-581(-)
MDREFQLFFGEDFLLQDYCKSVEEIFNDVKQKRKRFTNHSHRASLATLAAEAGATPEETITITGHQSTKSLPPYVNPQLKQQSSIRDF